MQLLAAKTPRIFTNTKEALFKHYNINEDTYHRRFRSAKAKDKNHLVRCITVMTAK